MERIITLQNSIQEVLDELYSHKIYKNLKTTEDIKTFMQNHVFAVWDFMSLLKSLQNLLTTTKTPWLPPTNPKTCRFINEIVLGEESDLNEEGEPMSHFEMYLSAMNQAGSNTAEINKFLSLVKEGIPISAALHECDIHEETRNFVRFTFEVIQSQKPHCIAAAFTFGREDIIPEMFLEILKNSDSENINFTQLKYYLDRHIELDGDEHGPLSLEMIKELCGDDDLKWQEVQIIAEQSINKRISLWDGINEDIQKQSPELV